MSLKRISRDEDGLITDLDNYIYTDEGLIDWRKMIDAKHLVPNKQRTKEKDVTKLKDYELIILLGGIKELAQIRGYTDVKYEVVSPSPDYVVATCSITWIPNYETEGREVTFSAIGDATPQNTQSFARFFLGPIAENRSFVRCVRNFLKINIVAQDEMGDVKLVTDTPSDQQEESSDNLTDPRFVLEKLMKTKGITFEVLKKRLQKEVEDGKWEYKKIDSLDEITDIPKIKTFELIERLQKYKGKK
jgi:hypothetical protein